VAGEKFKVSNENGMWVRTEPVVSKETERKLLPKGQPVTKLGESVNPDWWQVTTNFEGQDIEGFSKKTLMVAADQPASSSGNGNFDHLLARTLAAFDRLTDSHEVQSAYREAIQNGSPLFVKHGVTTPQRMAHFMAQVMQETGSFTVLRESMSYRVPRMLEIFGVGNHSARITAAEAPSLAHNEHALAERVYGLGNPSKAAELGNTQEGDGFRYRGNGLMQTTGRDAHRRMGAKAGLDFEGNPGLMILPEHALKPALQEWTDGNLNGAADHNLIVRITEVINGGHNGLPERRARLGRKDHTTKRSRSGERS
jgi:predicted chitinase